jgi:Na+-translocating ferredoxin:NAD+ oxidoreductase RNF subunit RnfB
MKYKWLPVFNLENCIGCGACLPCCPSESLAMVDGVISLQNPETCLSDERCVQECPNEGIHMEWVPINVSSCPGKLIDYKPGMYRKQKLSF